MSPWRGWGPILVLPPAVVWLAPRQWPRWLFMWTLAAAIFAGCKWLTWRRTTTAPGVPAWRHAAYLLAWPGLDAGAFLRPEPLPQTQRPAPREWGFAALRMILGVALFWGVGPVIPTQWDLLQGWVGMVGLILLLHFGSFHLLSCAWRAAGVDARPLMNRPLVAAGVSEFWGKRWNTAFRDLTHRFLFRPLTAAWGPRGGVLAGFAFSGLIHDLVISVPAGGGYGGPTLFFVIQAAAVLAERSRSGRRLGLGQGWRGRLFTLLALAAPVGLLFHAPFVRGVIVPFMKACGAA